MLLLCDSASGIYIPQRFANEIDRIKVNGVTEEEWEALEFGPDFDGYWDAWDRVIDNAVIYDKGETLYLYHNGDLWAGTETELEDMSE